ncbi:MAG: hypothetical protein QOF62_1228 [Pyrinomonadaceae bacterium]|nr:hypothetical protein [Pyrinomonadaceae bacterium]
MTNLISNRSCVTNIVRSTQTFRSTTPYTLDCRSQISSVVSGIESPAIREVVDVVFDDLLRLLECLDMIEVHLRKVEFAEQTFELFQLIHDDARVLVDFIHSDGLRPEVVTQELFDTLDGISFAVNHDLQRVFETSPTISATGNNSHAVVGRLYRAHDVLTNCLQQSTITLAMVFDPELEGAQLFNNSDMRFRQSLQLCEDLGRLIQLVSASEDDPKQAEGAALTNGIRKFRNESMELLMYSDWPQFESLCERIDTQQDAQQLTAVLHQFRCYLETLLGQVRMRAVLANLFPLGFGDSHFSSGNFGPAQIADGQLDWNHLAVAV